VRRSFVTHLVEELDVTPHVVEVLVNHIPGHKGGRRHLQSRDVLAEEGGGRGGADEMKRTFAIAYDLGNLGLALLVALLWPLFAALS
jgi:hypothetical protein